MSIFSYEYDFIIEFFDGSALILRTHDHQLFEINQIGKAILKDLLSQKEKNEIIQSNVVDYDIDEVRAEKDFELFIRLLETTSLLKKSDSAQRHFASILLNGSETDLIGLSQVKIPGIAVNAPDLNPKQRLCMHASSVVLNGKTVIFSGQGESGKSTIAEMLEASGYRVPGDEIAYMIKDEEGLWRLDSSYKKINGEYEFFEILDLPEISMIVYLRSHIPSGYTVDHCRPTKAVQECINLVYCDRDNDPGWFFNAFRWTCSLLRQTPAVYLDFEKSIKFFPEIIRRVQGDV